MSRLNCDEQILVEINPVVKYWLCFELTEKD